MTAPSNSANGAMLSPDATKIETASGLFVDVASPDPATLRLYDIAQGMALTCRYGGQIRCFYSVAEHALLVHDLLEHQGASRELRIAGLFHDAAEAYLGDVVAPLKYALRQHVMSTGEVVRGGDSLYDVLSDRMDEAIAERYGVDQDALNSPELRTADMWALRIEARSLTHSGGAHWRWPGELPDDGELPSRVFWLCGEAPDVMSETWLRYAARYDIAEPLERAA